MPTAKSWMQSIFLIARKRIGLGGDAECFQSVKVHPVKGRHGNRPATRYSIRVIAWDQSDTLGYSRCPTEGKQFCGV